MAKPNVAPAVLAPPLRARNGHEDILNTQIERSVEERHHHCFSKKYLKVFVEGVQGEADFFKKAVSPCITITYYTRSFLLISEGARPYFSRKILEKYFSSAKPHIRATVFTE